MKKVEGISRIDSEKSHSHGWFVRIYYGKGKEHRKFFSDGRYGGKKKALEQAIAYRDKYIQDNPPPEKLPYHREPTSRNTSGVCGVSETHTRKRSGEKVPYFSVFWAPKKNEKRSKMFYHHHYISREEAFREAVKFRKEKEAEILRLHKAGKR